MNKKAKHNAHRLAEPPQMLVYWEGYRSGRNSNRGFIETLSRDDPASLSAAAMKWHTSYSPEPPYKNSSVFKRDLCWRKLPMASTSIWLLHMCRVSRLELQSGGGSSCVGSSCVGSAVGLGRTHIALQPPHFGQRQVGHELTQDESMHFVLVSV